MSEGWPTTPSGFVGRAAELAELRELLRQHRLVSIVGPGGAGKTRLAAEAVRSLPASYSGSTWWCELGNLVDGTTLPSLIARATGIRLGADGSVGAEIAGLATGMNGRSGLLVLDNCEHVAESVAEAARGLLEATGPSLRLLVTSRRPLGIYGELDWPIPPMGLPPVPLGLTSDPNQLQEFDSTRLFLHRIPSVRRDLVIDHRTAATIVSICICLDGMPLAIEFAAARCRTVELSRVRAELADALSFLRGKGKTLGRHETMEASIGWSYALLPATERSVLRRLAVFAGGFTFEDAMQVVWGETHQTAAMLDSLESLADHSLLEFNPNSPGPPRYRLQEVVRQFAMSRLEDAGEHARFRHRHACHYLARACDFADVIERRWDGEMFAWLASDVDNLAVATHTLISEGDLRSAATLFCAAQHLWGSLRPREAALLAESILANSDGLPASDEAGLHSSLAIVWSDAGSLERAYVSATAALVGGEAQVAARAGLMAVAFASMGDPVGSEPLLRESIQMCAGLGDEWATRLGNVWLAAAVLLGQGASGRGRPLMQVALRSSQDSDPLLTAWALSLLGVAHADRGDALTALKHVNDTRKILGGLGDLLPGSASALSTSVAAVVADLAQGLVQIFRGELPLPHLRLDRSADDAAASGHVLGACIYRLLNGLHLLRTQQTALAVAELRRAQGPADLLGKWMGDRVRLATAWALLSLDEVEEFRQCATELASARSANPLYHCQLGAIQAEHALSVGDVESALGIARGDLKVAESEGFTWEMAMLLEVMACAAAARGDQMRAVRLLAATQQHRLDHTLLLAPPCHLGLVQTTLIGLKEAVGEPDFTRAWNDGRNLTLARAAAHADVGYRRRTRASTALERITPAEQEVMRLVAQGLTNVEVAQRLYVSRETVKTHLSHVFNKLGIHSRAEVGARAVQLGYLSESGPGTPNAR